MGSQLAPKSNDPEQRNSPYFFIISLNSVTL